jgi:hypothetical protein
MFGIATAPTEVFWHFVAWAALAKISVDSMLPVTGHNLYTLALPASRLVVHRQNFTGQPCPIVLSVVHVTSSLNLPPLPDPTRTPHGFLGLCGPRKSVA